MPDCVADAAGRRIPALVIGAGPAGLTTALVLRALGVPVTVLEADTEDRTRPGSRALFVHRDSLALLDRACPGLGPLIAERGIQWTRRETYYRGRCVYRKSYPPTPRDAMPPYASLRQVETEQFLRTACRNTGVAVRWGVQVTELDSTPEQVTVRDRGGRSWTADYVVGADGGRSVVRQAIGIQMLGDRSDNHHVVVDLADNPASPGDTTRTFHYGHPGVGGRHVLVVPFAGGRQVDLQCRSTDDPTRLIQSKEIASWLRHVLPADYLDRVLWASRYPFLQLVAESFTDVHRRVLLIGEAAHLFAPFGARGMNSAVADADAAAAAIAIAISCREQTRARGAVEDFDLLRRNAAAHNCAAAGAALAHLRPAGHVAQARLRLAGILAPVVPALGSWLEHGPYGPRTAASPTSYY